MNINIEVEEQVKTDCVILTEDKGQVKPIVTLKELSRLVRFCNDTNHREIASVFNWLRGRALGRPYCDFRYDCEQFICELEVKYPESFVQSLKDIINGN